MSTPIPLPRPLAALLLAVAPLTTNAQGDAAGYPAKPVRLVVPFAPGGTDLVARVVGKKLADAWSQPVVIDNRPGAGGAIGAETVAKSAPDGYTLMLTNAGPGVHSVLLRRKPAYAVNDFAPVIFIGYTPLLIVAHARFAPNNASELITYAKARPGKVSWGSSGINSNPHIALELLKSVAAVNIVHVPYKGSAPALTDVIAGQIDAMYTTLITAASHLQAGRVKALAVAGAKRQTQLPDVATLAEQGIHGADALLWLGLVSAATTPAGIIDKLNRDTNQALRSPDVRQQLAQLGIEAEGGAPQRLTAIIKTEVESVSRLIGVGTLHRE